jgi:bifunctional ADP-heptose synthase (sugar kinase/adenylyltransferase)
MIPLRSKSPIVAIGEAMLDRRLGGEVERISPEAPAVLRQAEREGVGGAANAARLGAVSREEAK